MLLFRKTMGMQKLRIKVAGEVEINYSLSSASKVFFVLAALLQCFCTHNSISCSRLENDYIQ